MASPNKNNVGVLGLGIIGSRVVENLRKAGLNVFVWSRSARAVPNFLASPREVAGVARVIQIFVRDGEALITALQDMAPALGAGHIILNHATVSPEATAKAAAICEATGAGFLDAPFTGSKNAAAAGKLVFYIGGDDALLAKARPVLEATSTKILPVGGIGAATVLKIATNLVTAVTVEALAEAMAITRGAGVAGEALLAALEGNANYSPLVAMKVPAMIAGNYEAHFSLRNMHKDVEFAAQMAAAKGLSLPALECTRAVMAQGVEQGRGDEDFSVIYQRLAGNEMPEQANSQS